MDPISTLTSPSSPLFSAWHEVGTPPRPLLQLLTHSTAPGGNDDLNMFECIKSEKDINLFTLLNRAELLFLNTYWDEQSNDEYAKWNNTRCKRLTVLFSNMLDFSWRTPIPFNGLQARHHVQFHTFNSMFTPTSLASKMRLNGCMVQLRPTALHGS